MVSVLDKSLEVSLSVTSNSQVSNDLKLINGAVFSATIQKIESTIKTANK